MNLKTLNKFLPAKWASIMHKYNTSANKRHIVHLVSREENARQFISNQLQIIFAIKPLR